MGFCWAAFHAGYVPKMMPITAEITRARMINQIENATGQFAYFVTIFAMHNPSPTPIEPPIEVRKIVSNRNWRMISPF